MKQNSARSIFETPKPARQRNLLVGLLLASVATLISGTSLSFAQESSPQNTSRFETDPDIPIRGLVRAAARAKISTEISARILKIGFREGQSFKKGDLLIEFDCRRPNAELASKEALLKESSIGLRSALYLKKRNAGNRHDVDIARARVDKARAEVEAMKIQLSECAIHAPFNGQVAGLNIQEHEFSKPSEPLISIVSMQEPEIEIVIPSSWLSWLKPGSVFNFTIDETGQKHKGQVLRLGAVVSAVSHTIKIFARFSEPSDNILPGMSGAVEFDKWLIRM